MEVKVHIWKTIGLSLLLYDMENLELRANGRRELEKLQSSIAKDNRFPISLSPYAFIERC